MNLDTEKKFQDIAFFHIEKKPPPPAQSNPLVTAAAGLFIALVLILIGYFICVRTGVVESCCEPQGSYDFAFDFEF